MWQESCYFDLCYRLIFYKLGNITWNILSMLSWNCIIYTMELDIKITFKILLNNHYKTICRQVRSECSFWGVFERIKAYNTISWPGVQPSAFICSSLQLYYLQCVPLVCVLWMCKDAEIATDILLSLLSGCVPVLMKACPQPSMCSIRASIHRSLHQGTTADPTVPNKQDRKMNSSKWVGFLHVMKNL